MPQDGEERGDGDADGKKEKEGKKGGKGGGGGGGAAGGGEKAEKAEKGGTAKMKKKDTKKNLETGTQSGESETGWECESARV